VKLAPNKPVHLMQKAGAFMQETDFRKVLVFNNFCGSSWHR